MIIESSLNRNEPAVYACVDIPLDFAKPWRILLGKRHFGMLNGTRSRRVTSIWNQVTSNLVRPEIECIWRPSNPISTNQLQPPPYWKKKEREPSWDPENTASATVATLRKMQKSWKKIVVNWKCSIFLRATIALNHLVYFWEVNHLNLNRKPMWENTIEGALRYDQPVGETNSKPFWLHMAHFNQEYTELLNPFLRHI